MAQRAVFWQQIVARNAVDIVQSDRLDPVTADKHGTPVALHFHSQGTIGNCSGVGKTKFHALDDFGLGAVKLFLGNGLCCHALCDVEQNFLACGRVILRPKSRAQIQRAAFALGVGACKCGLGQLAFNQCLVQSPGGLVTQRCGQHIQGRCIRMQGRRNVVVQQEQLCGRRSANHYAAFTVLGRIQCVGCSNGLCRPGQCAQLLLNAGERFFHIEFARHDEYCSVGAVVALVKGLQVADVHVFNIGLGTYRVSAIAMPKIGRAGHALAQGLKRVALTDLQLAAHHRHFTVQVFLGYKAVHHGIGLPAQIPVQRFLLRHKGSKVVGAIGGGRAVEREAALAELEFGVGRSGGALEDQVLQQMGHACFAVALVACTDQIR